MHLNSGETTTFKPSIVSGTPAHKTSSCLPGAEPEFGVLLTPTKAVMANTTSRITYSAAAPRRRLFFTQHAHQVSFTGTTVFNDWDDGRKLCNVHFTLGYSSQTRFKNHENSLISRSEVLRQWLEIYHRTSAK